MLSIINIALTPSMIIRAIHPGSLTGATPGVALSGLTPGTYYWQVSAVNAMGTRDANGSVWWSFTIVPLPGIFNKSSPPDGRGEPAHQPDPRAGVPVLARFLMPYRLDAIDDDTCNASWISTGTNLDGDTDRLVGRYQLLLAGTRLQTQRG